MRKCIFIYYYIENVRVSTINDITRSLFFASFHHHFSPLCTFSPSPSPLSTRTHTHAIFARQTSNNYVFTMRWITFIFMEFLLCSKKCSNKVPKHFIASICMKMEYFCFFLLLPLSHYNFHRECLNISWNTTYI